MADITEDELHEIIGLTAMEEYHRAEPSSQKGIRLWAVQLRELDELGFLAECIRRGRDGLISESQRGNDPDIYARLYGCMQESRTRHMANGHDRRCLSEPIYQKAQNRLRTEFGFEPEEPHECTCGKK